VIWVEDKGGWGMKGVWERGQDRSGGRRVSRIGGEEVGRVVGWAWR